jgi:hypothetical protein
MDLTIKKMFASNTVRNLFTILTVILVLFLGMHFLTYSLSGVLPKIVVDRFNLDLEANFPSWYQTMLLFSVGFASFLIYFLHPASAQGIKIWKYFWLIFGFLFTFLSFDESGRFHEIIDQVTPIKWVVIYAPLMLMFFLMTAFYFLKIRTDNPVLRNWIILGLLSMAAGGMGCEMLDMIFRPLPATIQQFEYMAEEGLEMFGTILVLIGCISEIIALNK